MSHLSATLSASVALACEVLSDLADLDWGAPAGDVEWSCRDTAAHVADDLFSYASQVIAQPMDRYLPIEARIEGTATVADVIASVAMCGELLRLAVEAAPPEARAGHPNGVSDPDGFAAMGALEVLVHTHDITAGLGVPWTPPASVSAAVVERLFPDAPTDAPAGGSADDPARAGAGEVLLWLSGRRALGSRPRRTRWSWDSTVR